MTSLTTPEVFCDWLDVTFSPTDCPYPEVNRLLLDTGFAVLGGGFQGGNVFTYATPKPWRGTVRVELGSRWAKVSASGDACAYLRHCGAFESYLWALASSGHTVTRLDATMDLAMDGADLVDALRRRYACGSVNLGRKAIATSTILAVRGDGRETGTWYAGYRSAAKAVAKVYDKAWQMLNRYGETIPPTGRVEVTAKKGYGATLRDAALPTGLFWHLASPALLKAPEGVPVWQPNDDLGGWQAPPRVFDPAALLRRRVEGMAELDALVLVADDLGAEGRSYLLHLLTQRVRADSEAVAA